MRLRRKRVIPERHTEFSPLLFDVLFGLLIFLGVAALIEFHTRVSFAFAAASLIVIVHWWLKYKAADETYGLDAGNSLVDLLFGLLEIVLLHVALMAASRGEILDAVFYLTLPLLTEAVWALLWRFCGHWRRTSRERIAYMEQQLETTLFLNLGAASALGALVANANALTVAGFVTVFVLVYGAYMFLTVRWELIDLKFF